MRLSLEQSILNLVGSVGKCKGALRFSTVEKNAECFFSSKGCTKKHFTTDQAIQSVFGFDECGGSLIRLMPVEAGKSDCKHLSYEQKLRQLFRVDANGNAAIAVIITDCPTENYIDCYNNTLSTSILKERLFQVDEFGKYAIRIAKCECVEIAKPSCGKKSRSLTRDEIFRSALGLVNGQPVLRLLAANPIGSFDKKNLDPLRFIYGHDANKNFGIKATCEAVEYTWDKCEGPTFKPPCAIKVEGIDIVIEPAEACDIIVDTGDAEVAEETTTKKTKQNKKKRKKK